MHGATTESAGTESAGTEVTWVWPGLEARPEFAGAVFEEIDHVVLRATLRRRAGVLLEWRDGRVAGGDHGGLSVACRTGWGSGLRRGGMGTRARAGARG
ncbi:hypothetical protein GCM10010404_09010 [Nonomuraea africana]